MSGFLGAKIAQFLPKNLTNRATIRSIFIQKLSNFIYREIPPDLIRASLRKNRINKPLTTPHTTHRIVTKNQKNPCHKQTQTIVFAISSTGT